MAHSYEDLIVDIREDIRAFRSQESYVLHPEAEPFTTFFGGRLEHGDVLTVGESGPFVAKGGLAPLLAKHQQSGEGGPARGTDDMDVAGGGESLTLGTLCKIHGLQSKPELNGSFARVAKYLPASDRYSVVTGARVLSLKVSNLMRHAEPTPAPATKGGA